MFYHYIFLKHQHQYSVVPLAQVLKQRRIKVNSISKTNRKACYSYSSIKDCSVMQLMQSLTIKFKLELHIAHVEPCTVAE